jgi:hypothetical protein
MRTYLTWQEDEAYRDGRKDASFNHNDMTRTPKMFADYDTPDKAYWDGIDDYRKSHCRCNEETERYWDDEYERWRQGE